MIRNKDCEKSERGSAVVAGPDRALLHLDRELRDRLVGGRAQGPAVAQVELRPVQHALHGAGVRVHGAGGELVVLVGALVLHGIEVAVEVDHQDRRVAVPGHGGFAGQQLGGGAHAYPVAHRGSSSFSSTSKRRSSRSGTPKRSSPYGKGFVAPVRR